MTAGHSTLTEKEKQVLRLLVNGYDAKSMARHLGLSVHTVNERLREARRKMATSSSREAARLLHQLEGPTPQLLADKDFGADMAGTATPHAHHQATDQANARRALLRPGWIVGGIAMLITLAALALAMPLTPVQEAPNQTAAGETASVNAARQWLALVDANDWNASWDATGPSFKSLNTAAKWAEVSNQVRKQLGASKGRELISAEFAPAPPNGVWLVKFRGHYANKADAIETLSLVREADSWKVVGIFID